MESWLSRLRVWGQTTCVFILALAFTHRVTLICLALCFLICKMKLKIMHGCFELFLRTHSVHGKDYILFVIIIIFLNQRHHWRQYFSCGLLGDNINAHFYNWELRKVLETNVGIYKNIRDILWIIMLHIRRTDFCISFNILK